MIALNKLFLIFISITIVSCSTLYKPLEYKYINSVEKIIEEAINKIEQSKIKPSENEGALFILFETCNGSTSMIFNYIENMPPNIQKHINNSHRYLLMDNKKIPIIFDSDDGSSFVREGGINYGIIGGYVLQFDNEGNKILSGIAN